MRFSFKWFGLAALLMLEGTALASHAAAQSTAPSPSEPLLQVEGVLEAGDEVLEQDGSLYDIYSFEGQAGQAVSIVMESAELDSYVWLFGPQDEQLATNDDFDDTTLSAGILVTLPEDGTYSVVANAQDPEHRGRYRLVVQEVLPLAGGEESLEVEESVESEDGIEIEESVETAD